MKSVGYARLSTIAQNLDLQIVALTAAGCTEIFTDQGASGADFQHPGLRRALRHVQNGDMLVVWRLDRLGVHSSISLRLSTGSRSARGSEFRSLTESIDTSSSGGRLLFHVMGAMAEFERSIISERTKAGMEAARARGAQIGRRPALDRVQVRQTYEAVHSLSEPVRVVASRFNVHPKTLSRIINQARSLFSMIPAEIVFALEMIADVSFLQRGSCVSSWGRIKTCQVGQVASIYLAFTPNPDLAVNAVAPEGAHCARHYHHRHATNVVVAASSIHRALSFGILFTLEACGDNLCKAFYVLRRGANATIFRSLLESLVPGHVPGATIDL